MLGLANLTIGDRKQNMHLGQQNQRGHNTGKIITLLANIFAQTLYKTKSLATLLP